MRRFYLAVLCVALVLPLLHAVPAEAGEARRGTDYVLLVDNTGSMKYGERAENTVEGLRVFVGLMKPGDCVSIYSYGEKVVPVLKNQPVYITDDASKQSVRNQLKFSFDADRTDITAGVERVWRERGTLFPTRKRPSGGQGQSNAVVVLMTDGKLIPVYQNYSRYEAIYRDSRKALERLAEQFGTEQIPIHVVGVGRKEEDVAGSLMRHVARKSNGTLHYVPDAPEIAKAYMEIMDITGGSAGIYGDFAFDLSDTGAVTASWGRQSRTAYKRTASWVQYLPPGLLERYASFLALFVGIVVLGVERKKPWAMAFMRTLGKSETRVRGYLRPVSKPGIMEARPIIGLENPGLASVMVGVDTPYADHCRETSMEFIGTTDGSPPELRIEQGCVMVEGEEVEESRKLKDGDILEIEQVLYKYLRGSRR